MARVDPDQTLIKPDSTQSTAKLPPSSASVDPDATLNLPPSGTDSDANVEATVDLPATRVTAAADETVAITADGSASASPRRADPAFEATLPQGTRDLLVDPNEATQDMGAAAGRKSGGAAHDATMEATLPHGGTATVLPAGSASTRQTGTPSPTRYRIMRPHARGGLGEVFVAIDEELRREVALKEIQPRHADHHESRTRFLIEAEVTGGLEHPGIVPVYGLGEYEDGRPYYAMRFIRGDSLRKAIERYHSEDAAQADPGERALELRGLLNRFIDVCDAIHYAHCRGVLHRDLKPDNIMLGDFGETLVVDWGLAKPMGLPEPEGGATLSQLRPMSASSGSVTMIGSAVGTPQFMSPEQAEGKLDQLGPAADIYSLGATLYQLVAGTVPFQERTIHTLLAAVKRGGFRPPRQANRDVPPALEAVCMKAMALKPEDRYPTAKALASDIEHWLADEPVSVYREPFSVRAMRWAKRHRTFVTTSGSLLVVAVVGLSVGAALINRERARTEVQRQLAEKNFGQARDAVDQMLTELGEVDLADVPQAEPVRKKMLQKALTFYQSFLEQRRNDPSIRQGTGQAAIRLGDILEMLGDYDAAEGSYHEAMGLLEPLAKHDPSAKSDLARAHHQLAILLKKSSRYRASEQEFQDAIRARKELAAAYPNRPDYRKDVRDSVYHLGALLAKLPGRLREVEDSYRTAVEEQKTLVSDLKAQPDNRRKLAKYLNNLGILVQKTKPTDAEAVFREALKHQEALVAEAPTVMGYQWELARTHSNLGAVLIDLEHQREAEAEYQRSIDSLKILADAFPTVPDYRNELAAVRYNLARARFVPKARIKEANEATIQLDEAIEADFRDATSLLEALVAAYPRRPDYRQRLAMAYSRLGFFLEDHRNDFKAADLAYQSAKKILEQIVASYDHVPEYSSSLATVLSQAGRFAYEKKRALDEAARLFETAIQQEDAALEGDPKNRFYRVYLRNDVMLLASTYLKLAEHAKAAAVAARLPKLFPDEPLSVAGETCRYGRVLAKCSALAGNDTTLTPARRKELQEDYARRSIETLREAVKNGFRDTKQFAEPDYDTLRKRPDFQQFLKSLESKSDPIIG